MSDSLWPHGLYSLLGSSAQGICLARTLEWVAIFFLQGNLYPGIEPVSSALAGGFFTAEPSGRPFLWYAILFLTF